jgi:endonuclease/exonuclease/phosphatase family metal-dependent hydrolase
MRQAVLAVALFAACAHAPARDRSIEATSPPQARTAPLPRQLRVVTFNLHGEPGAKIARALRDDPALRDADVIVLDEVHGHRGCSSACEIARAFGYHAVFAPEFADRDGTDGVAIVSRAPIEASEVIELPYFNVHINDEHRKAALAATIELDGRAITVYAVHLTNRLTVAQRARQLAPVLAHADRQTNPVIIAGDFNTSPFTWIAHVIPIPTGTQDDRLERLARAHGLQTPVVRSGATSRWLAMKLDGIYTRGFQTVAYATADADDVSDHFALWAQLVAR